MRWQPGGGVAWRALVPAVAMGSGVLLATSAHTASGTDLRSSRSLKLSQQVAAAQRELTRLTGREKALRDEVDALTAAAGASDAQVAGVRARADALAAPAGLTALTGPGLVVVLDDAPRPASGRTLPGNPKPDDLVVHQQDVQAVVNALWAGGAEAMTLMGQRVTATTAVRCVGNTLLLRDRVYSPPFTVAAIGDVRGMRAALDAAPDVQVYRQYVAAYGLGYDVRAQRELTVPAYDGPLDLVSAAVAQ